MKRRDFVINSSIFSAGIASGLAQANNFLSYKNAVIGHNSHQYKIDLQWGALNSNFYPVNDCHEMVQDSQGRIILLTNHTKNNIIVYDRSGKLLEVWGTQYPGAHGLTLHIENGEDVLYISDNNRHEVIKTTIGGKVIQVFPYPKESGKYEAREHYIPTETAIAPNGDVYVADGYGEQYILHYNANGKLLNVFGGRGEEDRLFNNAHGICLDTRDVANPTLLITARQQNKLKRFSLGGEYLSAIDLPGAYICRPVIHDKHVYLATIWSGDGSEGTGFVSILDEEDKLISAPGGCKPIYVDEQLNPMYQTIQVFRHPHDVCVDDDENLYVAQWNSGKTYPIKLYRV
ncbi:6-bladed beta-propeller [Maribacter sp. 2304DJ31-5]|uniref:6-bladed beta-propeller n=1 Tax=Maribacter sp. 2304DJ31-5 TaxID=3386273 RepID=UPI0039BC9A88